MVQKTLKMWPKALPHPMFERRSMMILTALALIVLALYWPAMDFELLHFDDDSYLMDNQTVRSGLTLSGIRWAFTTFSMSNWHPLTWLSYMLDVQMFGLNAGGHHLVNVLWHTVNSLLLLVVLSRMTANFWTSALTAVLFAIHPLHVESVAWVSERKDVLSGFFWIAAMAAYWRYAKKPNSVSYVVVVMVFGLGLMAKPMLVTLPLVLLLLDYWPLGRIKGQGLLAAHRNSAIPGFRPSTLALEKVPLLGLSMVSSAISLMAQLRGGTLSGLELIPLGQRLANAAVAYARYIGKMIWPAKLAAFYPHPLGGLPPWQLWLSVILLFLVTAAAALGARRYPFLVVGWLWFVGTLVPVIGLVQVGGQSMADRYTYIPLVGLFLAISTAVATWFPGHRQGKVVVTMSCALLLVALFTASHFQLRHWRNDFSLFKHGLNVTQGNWILNNNMGTYYLEQGQFDQSMFHYLEAIRLKPTFDNPYFNIGVLLEKQGKIEEATRYYRQTVAINPYYSDAFYNLGNIAAGQRRYAEAIDLYSKALAINKYHIPARNNLGLSLLRMGRREEALTQLVEVVSRIPNDANYRFNLGTALETLGRRQEAYVHYREALRLQPNHQRASMKLRSEAPLTMPAK